jgi:transcriptional regulator with XRE-family HTH domain
MEAKSLPAVRARLAENIRRLREEKAIRQEHFAYQAGIDRAYYGKIERAEVNPTLNVLCKLADFLDVEVSSLLQASATKNVRRKGSESQKP